MTFRSSQISSDDGTSDKSLPNLEGYLEKKGDKGPIKSWKRRYFVLRRDRYCDLAMHALTSQTYLL